MTQPLIHEPEDGRALLSVRGLDVHYKVGRGRPPFRAVNNVDLEIRPRETVGLVGESGCGKTTLSRAILGLTPITGGSVIFNGQDITRARDRDRRQLSANLQVVFQDPYSSLNPARTIGQTLAETLRVHEILDQQAVRQRVRTMLEKVGMPPGAAARFPSQFSGGQRQRIAIARALMAHPKLVICDEAVSALDLSIQAQVLNLLHDLQIEFELSYLFVAHDLAVVRHVSHRIVVLYAGSVMEEGTAQAVYDSPKHPYTQTLLNAAPVPDPVVQRARRQARPPGARFGVARPDQGCVFAGRCPDAIKICHEERPELRRTTAGSLVACHRAGESDQASGTPRVGHK